MTKKGRERTGAGATGRAARCWLAGAMLAALALRWMQAPQVIWGEGLIPLSPDAHYHIRLALRFLDGRYSLPLFEPLFNYPNGAWIYWPPGFDLLLALVALPVKLAGGGPQAVTLVFGLLMPVLALVALWFFFRAARALVTEPWAPLAATFLLATSFSITDISLPGRIDHHILEVVGWCLVLGLLIRSVRDPDAFPRTARLLGGVLGAFLFLWNGAIVVIALAHGWMLLRVLSAGDRDRALAAWRTTARWAVPPALAAILVTGTVWRFPFSSVYLSFFHLAAVLAPLALAEGWQLARRSGISRPVMVLGGAAMLLLLALVLSAGGGQLFHILSAKDLNAATVMESEGLIRAYRLSILFQPLLLLALPVLVMLVAHGWRHRDGVDLPQAGVLAVTLGLSVFQIRFVTLLEPVTALGVVVVADRLSRSGGTGRRRWLPGLVLLVVVSAGYVGWAGWTRNREFPVMKAMVPVMRWMAAKVPENGATISPVWSYGHYVVGMADRPVASCAFGGTPAFERGITASLLIGFAGTEEAIARIMNDVSARYLLLPDLSTYRYDLRRAWIRAGYDPLPKGRGYAVDRLFDWNNGRTDTIPEGDAGASRFRLLYESPYRARGRHMYRLFERVSGAVVTGTVPDPSRRYLATVALLSSGRDPMLWRKPLESDATGRFELVCPYATGDNGSLQAISSLEIWDMKDRKVVMRCRITEDDLAGRTVTAEPVQEASGSR